MFKYFAVCAAIAATAMIALPNSSSASERRADGARNADQIEFSSARRQKRRYVNRRYYNSYYNAPYYAYAPRYGYAPRPYYHRPAPLPFFGFPF